jgi:hypothetical protein
MGAKETILQNTTPAFYPFGYTNVGIIYGLAIGF